MSSLRRVVATGLAGVALATGTLVGSATPAFADAPPEYDQVAIYQPVYDSMTGRIYWPSSYSGSATIDVYNENDGLCVWAQHRYMRNGVWTDWKTLGGGALCRYNNYRFTPSVPSGAYVQYWQFRFRDADTGWQYDTNTPGGA